MMSKFVVIIVAAGEGARFVLPNGYNIPKQYYKIGKKSILARTIEVFAKHPDISAIKVVISKQHLSLYEECIKTVNLGDCNLLPYSIGGTERNISVLNALSDLQGCAPEYVLIQDGCRPYTSCELIGNIIEAVKRYGAVVPVIKSENTLKRVIDNKIVKTLDRTEIFQVQTPQAFIYKEILELSSRNILAVTDDAAIYENFGEKIYTVIGDKKNIKITTIEDIMDRECIYRTGTGYDVHRVEATENLENFIVLGGVKIASKKAIIAHSDGDVLIHAIIDAILGACALNDIGYYFPPSDDQYKDADSGSFLKKVMNIINEHGFELINIDATIICERPKILPHRDNIRMSLAEMIGLDVRRVGVKATTTEKLGFTGRDEGIAVQAVATVRECLDEVD